MFINDQQIIKFQMLYKNRFGKEINRDEAYEKGVKLVRMMQLIYRPMTVAAFQKLQARRKQTGDL